MAKSVEEKVEEIFKKQLDDFKVRHYTKTESINPSIDDALKNSVSKSGGSGNNYPDIRVLIETSSMRRIPVMIEAKGTKDRLIKYAKGGKEIELVTKWTSDSKEGAQNPHKAGDDNYSTIRDYAVNGAVHYVNAILDGKGYDEGIAIGVNGYTVADGSVQVELEAFYVSEKNSRMAHLARTNKDSFVWDKAMGSAGFLVAAMDIMIKDAQEKIKDTDELKKKIKNIKENQLLGIEILGNIYILAVLNMILMGDGSSNMINDDSFKYDGDFPATVFLLNPPYSAPGKGFNFVEKALKQMTKGYACVLIQENAGSGQGEGYPKLILEKNTLLDIIITS